MGTTVGKYLLHVLQFPSACQLLVGGGHETSHRAQHFGDAVLVFSIAYTSFATPAFFGKGALMEGTAGLVGIADFAIILCLPIG